MEPKHLILRAASALLFAATAHGADRDYLEDADFPKTVTIAFNGTAATVSSVSGVTVTRGTQQSHVIVQSTAPGVQFVLSGSSTDGYLEITSASPTKVLLNGVSLVSSNGPALSTLSPERNHIVLAAGSTNTLSDSATSTRTGTATLYGTGPLIVSGSGSLSVAGLKSHAIASADYYRSLGGDVKVTAAVKDGIHVNDWFRMDQGWLSITASGDGIDADTGFITVNGGHISVRSTVDDTKGLKCDGTLTVNGGNLSLTVDGVQSKALSSKSDLSVFGGSVAVNMAGAVLLQTVTGTTTYTDPSYSTGLKTDGNLVVGGGSVTVTHTGLAGKGLSAGGNLTISGGTVDVMVSGGETASYTNSAGVADTAAADCLTASGTLSITAGTVIARATGTSGDCLSANGAVAISGGILDVTVAGVSGDGISSDLTLGVTGGTLVFTGKGNQSKALKSTGAMNLAGGTMTFTMSGAVVLETVSSGRYNPAYCTAVKCDSNLTISNGSITITHSGQAGKGISANGNLVMTGGTITVNNSGANTSSYTNSSGTLDMAGADCMTADGNLTITGGTINATTSGNAGDSISCDGVASIGTAGVSATPSVTARTTGARVLLSGSGMSADYVNPKALRAEGNFNILGGLITASTSQNGGEGIESKATLTISGGTVDVTSYDDGLNATTRIAISGGSVYCYSANNDGIDSNGTFAMSGGVIVTSGSTSPEEGFDCDSNNFAVTGGVLIGTGGATSTPTTASTTQRCVIYRGPGSINTILHVTSASGSNLIYKIPRTYGTTSTSMTMLFSNAALTSGTTYSIVSGATVTGGTEFHGYYTGATVSGGTTLKTFNPTGMVTTVQ